MNLSKFLFFPFIFRTLKEEIYRGINQFLLFTNVIYRNKFCQMNSTYELSLKFDNLRIDQS